ncbi:MAG: hypothetical protein OEU26_06050 [Candidatus Tectomicrobia bacterium]|nr:hypothetical protein [Candidatus Tectomicrobia bacterium]
MIKRTSFLVLMLGVLLATGPVQAGDGFTLESVQGTWGFTTPGSIGGVPVSAVGRTVFDGAGGCETTATLNLGGTLIPLTSAAPGGQCAYTVNLNGAGAVKVTFIDPSENPSDFRVSFVIIDKETEYRFITSDSAGQTVGVGVAKRQGGNAD